MSWIIRIMLTLNGKAKKLDQAFHRLECSESSSLLKKHLTRPVFECLKDRATSHGSTLLDVIQSGVENPDSGVGVYAPDPEAYTVFRELFDPIIEDYHGFDKEQTQPNKDWGSCMLGNLDPEGEHVVSTRVRCGRSLDKYPFNPNLSKQQYEEIEKKICTSLSCLKGELQGNYHGLSTMSKETQNKLVDDHLLFKEGDRFLKAANANRFWPTGRGIFLNYNKSFLVWVNEEDHLRLISMEKGGDVGKVLERLITAEEALEKHLSFAKDPRLGFLTFCPTNLGTTIRASVHVKLPKLSSSGKLNEAAETLKLQVRGTRGEHSETEKGVFDVSNKRRLGLTEFQAVREMYDGVKELIKMEKCQ